MPRNIRMPDGTVIRGVPDGVSKQEFSQHLIQKIGQERYDQMTGSQQRDLPQPDAKTPEPAGQKKPAQVTSQKGPKKAPNWDVDTEWDETFGQISSRDKHPPGFLKRQAWKESRFDPNAQSQVEGQEVGAQGMMQVMPVTQREMGIKNPFDPDESIDKGSAYLRKKIDEFDGDVEKGIAAYHSGAARVKRLVKKHGDNWKDGLGPAGKDYVDTLGPEYKQLQARWEEKQANTEKQKRAKLDEIYPDRMTPREIAELQAAASRDAMLNAEYAETSPSDYEMDFKPLPKNPTEARGEAVRSLVNSGQYTAEEIGISQDDFEILKAPVKETDSPEDIKFKQDKAMYQALVIENPELARKQYPHVIERMEAQDLEAAQSRAIAGEQEGPKGFMAWMKHAKTSIKGGLSNSYQGWKMAWNAAGRQGTENKLIGQKVMQNVREEYKDLDGDAKEELQFEAEKRGLSIEEMAFDNLQSYLRQATAEGESFQTVMDNLAAMEATMPQSAKATKLGHWANLLVQNSTQAAYITAGMMLRSPLLTMSAMGTEIYGKEYSARRLQGRTHDEANMDATAAVIIEGVSEGLPVANAIKLLKAGKRSKFKRLMAIGAGEFQQELYAEAFAIGWDLGVVKEDMTWGEAFNRMVDAGVVGLAMGTVMAAPAVGMMNTELTSAQEEVNDAKKRLSEVAKQAQNPNVRVDAAEVKAAKEGYVKAIKAKGKVILEIKERELEKKKAKQDKKEAKRVSKLSGKELAREEAQKKQAEKDQKVSGTPTNEDIQMALVLEKGMNAELTSEDMEGVQAALDAGYMRISEGGTPLVLDAGKRRVEAVRQAERGEVEKAAEEVIEPIEYQSPERRAEIAAIEEEIGQRLRGEEVNPEIIKARPFTSYVKRKQQLTRRVDKSIKDPETQARIVDAIIKEDQQAAAYAKREAELEAEHDAKVNEAYDKALKDQNEVEAEVALNLSKLDQKSTTKFTGTKLGKVLRDAYKKLEQAEKKATKELKKEFWNNPVQGTLFDVSGVLVKGTKQYANLVKVGALKIAKHGLKYSAWSADMIGEFGESIKPVVAKVYHDAKKMVSKTMRMSHEKFTTGERKGELKYAPKMYTKPGEIRKLRNLLRKLAMEGEEGRMWYERSGKEILKITGGNIEEARLLAGLFAIYSSGTAVSANTTNALKLWAQFQGGKREAEDTTIAGRFTEQDRTAMEWLQSNKSDEYFAEVFGNKRFPFYQNIMREIDPENYEVGQGVTIDLWMMRAFGFDQDAPTDPQFAFATSEIQNLAKSLGWEPQQVQAAIWVAIKSRWEHIQKKAKAEAISKGLAKQDGENWVILGKDRDAEIANEKEIIMIFRKNALAVPLSELKKRLEESKKDFADNLEKHYATMSWEAEPSTTLGSPINMLSLAQKMMMQVEIAEALTNPATGREYLAEWLGLLGDGQFLGVGAFEMQVGAATQNALIAPVRHRGSTDKYKTVQPEAKDSLDGYAAIMGLILQQDAVAWHKPFYAQAQTRANGVEIATNGPLTPEQTRKFYDAIVKVANEAGKNGIEWAPIVMDGVVRVMNFEEFFPEVKDWSKQTEEEKAALKKYGELQKEFHKLIVKAADEAGIGGNVELFQSDGSYISNDWNENPKGEGYVQTINNIKNPAIKKAAARAKRELAPRIAKIRNKYAGKTPHVAEQISVTRLTDQGKLKRLPKGKLRFRHFGKHQVSTISTEKFGTGIPGQESRRGAGIVPVISAYPNKGFTKEVGLGKHEYVIDVPKSRMYDINEDPLSFKDRAQEPQTHKMIKGKLTPVSWRLDMTALEKLIKDAGFLGYYTPKAEGNLKGQARFFHSLVINDANNSRPEDTTVDTPFAISDRPRVTVVENEFDEYEVREDDGEVYYTDDPDDAISTARSIYGAESTVVIVDQDGETITTDVASTKPKPIKLKGFKPDPDAGPAIDEFIDEWIELTTQNPLGAERILDNTSAVELEPRTGHIWLSSIRSFDKGRGNGSQALKTILELADLHGVRLEMIAKPFDAGGNELENNALISWYQRNGFQFVENGGRHMFREPRNPDAVDAKFIRYKRPTQKTNKGYGTSLKVVQDLGERFSRMMGLSNVDVVEAVEDLPDVLYSEIMKVPGLNYTVSGAMHEGPNGPTIYLIANNIMDNNMNASVSFVMNILWHESVGHLGMRAYLGDKGYEKFTDWIIKSFPTEVARRGEMLGKTLHGRRLAAEEVFAYTVGDYMENTPLSKQKINMIQRAMIRLKLAIKRITGQKMSDKDLLSMMRASIHYTQHTDTATLQKRALAVEARRKVHRAMERKEERILNAEIEDAGKAFDDYVQKKLDSGEWNYDNFDDMYAKDEKAKELLSREEQLKEKRERAGFHDLALMSGLELKQARKDDPDLDRFMAKIGHPEGGRTRAFLDWWDGYKRNLRKRAEIEILDQYAGIKHIERELGILDTDSSYISIRMTAGADVVIRSALENGAPVWDSDGSVRVAPDHQGLIEILSPIAQNKDMLKAFEAYLVAHRAKRLKKENREKLFSREEIGAALKYIRRKKLYKLFRETADSLAEYKKRVLDFAQDGGLVDPVSRELWENNDHVPFYRVLGDKTSSPFSGVKKLGHVGRVIHQLKGGEDPLKQPLQSLVENLSVLIEASMKNRAMSDLVKNLDGTGAITKAPQAEFTTALVPMAQVKDMLFEAGVSLDAVGQDMLEGVQKLMALRPPQGDNVFSVQVNGTKQYYYAHDAGVLRAIDNISPAQWIWLMKALRFPKRVLTRTITLMPDFILKNWFRDIWHAFVLGRHGTIIPIVDSARGWAKAIAHDETFQDVMSGGGMFDSGYVNATDPDKTKVAIRRGLLQAGRGNILDTPRKLQKFYMRIANGAENAHRIVVYEKALKATGSRKLSLFEARDLMDFSVRGANPVIRFLCETVPFWGARVQGLARTGKGFTESPGQTFLRGMPIMLASLALYAMNRDDDRYKGLSPYEKRMYYHFYDVFEKGDHYQLPRPFEIGAMFSTIPEIQFELFLSNQPDRGKEMAKAMSWTITEMLSLGPYVQTIAPLWELYTNENSFTEAPIVNPWEERLHPTMQVSPNTSETATTLAQAMPEIMPDALQSPKKLEHLMKGYFGSMMDAGLALSDLLVNKLDPESPAAPSWRWDETPLIKSFKREETGKYGLYLDNMYEVMGEADKIYNAIQKLKKDKPPGWKDRVKTFEERNEPLLYARVKTKQAKDRVSIINKKIRKVQTSMTLTPDEKREQLDALYDKRSEAAKKVYDYRPGGTKNKYTDDTDTRSYYERLIEALKDKPKEEQVDALISQQLPHTATLINDITIDPEKLRSLT